MDRLRQKGKENKRYKSWLKNEAWTTPSGKKWRARGTAHIKEEDYGKILDLFPLTNRYVQHLKKELKIEYRAVKRSEKQYIKKEIEQILLDEKI